jgi:hypothetical protein
MMLFQQFRVRKFITNIGKRPLSPARVRDVAILHILAIFIVKMT